MSSLGDQPELTQEDAMIMILTRKRVIQMEIVLESRLFVYES